jgi:CheY-like chemotaxis protein
MGKLKIVIVEDESIVARDIQNSLKNMGYGVPAVVSTGEKAIEAVHKFRPDLILMDIMLKGEMSGIEAAKIIKDRFDIPVIFSHSIC